MLSLVLEQLHAFQHAFPLLFYSSCLVTILFLILLSLVEYFKPVGKRKGQSGIKPRLPAGPAGVPLFGCLLTLKNVREDPDRQEVNFDTIPLNNVDTNCT